MLLPHVVDFPIFGKAGKETQFPGRPVVLSSSLDVGVQKMHDLPPSTHPQRRMHPACGRKSVGAMMRLHLLLLLGMVTLPSLCQGKLFQPLHTGLRLSGGSPLFSPFKRPQTATATPMKPGAAAAEVSHSNIIACAHHGGFCENLLYASNRP
jgi:hypothetical protein